MSPHNRMCLSALFVFASVCVLSHNSVHASDTQTSAFYWNIHDTGFSSSPTAVAMRNGQAWPVIFTQHDAISLFATSNGASGSGWYQIGEDLYDFSQRMRAATSPDGRVALATANPYSAGPGVVSSLPTGWVDLPVYTTAVAFDSAGNLYSANANNNTISGVAVAPSISGSIVDIAVSVNGDIGVLDSSMRFHEFSPLLGAWYSTELSMPVSPLTSSLTYDSLGRPHVIGIASGAVWAADFNIQSGTWTKTQVNTGLPGSVVGNLELDANDDGVIGSAFQQDGTLYYAYKEHNTSWAVTSVDSGIQQVNQVGIAYDFEGLPVISYCTSGRIHLAYDPVITIPEPSMGMILLLPLMHARRHTRRF